MADEQDSGWKVIGDLLKAYLLLVLGAVFMAVGAAGGVRYNGWFPIDNAYWQYFVVVVGAIFVALHLFTRQNPKVGLDAATIKALGIKINAPDNNATIVGKVDVRGSIVRPLPKGYELRILRGYPHGGFVPHAQSLCDHDKKEFLVPQFDIAGAKNDSRTIEAWLVGPDGKLLLDTWLADHAIHRATNSQLEKAAPSERLKWLDPIKGPTADMYRCTWIKVVKG